MSHLICDIFIYGDKHQPAVTHLSTSLYIYAFIIFYYRIMYIIIYVFICLVSALHSKQP